MVMWPCCAPARGSPCFIRCCAEDRDSETKCTLEMAEPILCSKANGRVENMLLSCFKLTFACAKAQESRVTLASAVTRAEKEAVARLIIKHP